MIAQERSNDHKSNGKILATEARKDGFVRIITNPLAEPLEGRRELKESGFSKMKAYFDKLTAGDGRKAYCPFTPAVEKQNGYYFRLDKSFVEGRRLSSINIVEAMVNSFFEISPKPTSRYYLELDRAGSFDPTVLAIGFTNPRLEREFSTRLKDFHSRIKNLVRIAGLMTANVSPYHELGGRDGGTIPMFVSEIPMIILRRMHSSDSVFMKDETGKRIYAMHF